MITLKKIRNIFVLIFIICIAALMLYPNGYYTLKQGNNTIVANNNFKTNKVTAYIINLDTSPQRYQYISQYVNKLGLPVQRVAAINGAKIKSNEIPKVLDTKQYKHHLGHIPKAGTIGCSLSHIKAWQTFLQSDSEFALIFEDDVSFDSMKMKQSVDNLLKNKNIWDIGSFEISHHGAPLLIKKLDNTQNLVVYTTEVADSGAYIINRKAAIKLLNKALPIVMPIDHYFTRAWEFNLAFTGIEPRIVKQTFGNSNIGSSNRIIAEKTSLTDKLKKISYKLQSYTIRALYNIKIYLANNNK